MIRTLIFLFLFLLLSCSSKDKDAKNIKVLARVGEKTLTEESVVLLGAGRAVSEDKIELSIENWINQSLLLSEARKEGFENDLTLIKKRDSYYDQLIISSFVENHISSRIRISKEDVRLYYRENKGSFIRNLDEVQIEQYIMKSEKEARKLTASFESKRGANTEVYSILSVNQKTIKKGVLLESVDIELFDIRKKAVGPVFLGSNICVLKVLNRYKKGSYRGLDEVYDEVYQRLYKSRTTMERGLLLDSLKKTVNIFINPEYQ